MFILGFKLNHEAGLQSVFYEGRSFSDDANIIFTSLNDDSLFIFHDCKLVLHEAECMFEFCVEGFDLSLERDDKEATLACIRLVISKKLALLGLYDHFYLAKVSIAPSPQTITSLIFTCNPQALRIEMLTGKNTKELECMNFPSAYIPKEFEGKVTLSIMDIPVRDPHHDQCAYEQSTYRYLARDNKPNPMTNRPLSKKMIVDYVLWDKISSYMEKVRLIHQAGFDFFKYMEEILDKQLSCPELAAQLKLSPSLSLEDLAEQAPSAYKKYRITNAHYYFKQLLKSFPEGEENSAEYFHVLVQVTLTQLKLGLYDEAIPAFERLNNSELVCHDNLMWACVLSQVAKFHIAKDIKEDYQLATQLIIQAKKLFECEPDQSSEYLHIGSEKRECSKFELLAKLHCQDSFSGHCKAVRRATASGTTQELQQCIDQLRWYPGTADNNRQRGFSALHWALNNNRVNHAWLLRIAGSPLDTKSATFVVNNVKQGGQTPEEMIAASDNPKIRALAMPFITLNINLNPLADEGINVDPHKLINDKLPLFLEKIGFPQESMAFYFQEKRVITLGPCRLKTPFLQQTFPDFCNKVVAATPELSSLFSIRSLDELPEQANLFEDYVLNFSFSINKIQWQEAVNAERAETLRQMPHASNPNLFLARNFNQNDFLESYIRPVIGLVRQMLGANFLGLLAMSERGLRCRLNLDALQFTISFDCKTAPYLNGLLNDVIEFAVQSRFQDQFTCDEITMLDSNHAPNQQMSFGSTA